LSCLPSLFCPIVHPVGDLLDGDGPLEFVDPSRISDALDQTQIEARRSGLKPIAPPLFCFLEPAKSVMEGDVASLVVETPEKK